MKALTLAPPTSAMIALGHQTIVTQGYATVHRGQLAIYASSLFTPPVRRRCVYPPYRELLHEHGYRIVWRDDGRIYTRPALKRGRIVAVCDLVDVVQAHIDLKHGWDATSHRICEHLGIRSVYDDLGRYNTEVMFNEPGEGDYMWLLSNVVRLPNPVRVTQRGWLPLWDTDEPASLAVLSQIDLGEGVATHEGQRTGGNGKEAHHEPRTAAGIA